MKRYAYLVPLAGVLIAASVPFVVRYARARREAADEAAKETSIIATLVVILSGQATFHKTDSYGIEELVYANHRDGRGLRDLYDLPGADGTTRRMRLLDQDLYEAVVHDRPYRGYRLVEIAGDENGPFDPRTQFAICAIPDPYTPGKKTHFLGQDGSIWSRDTGGKLPPQYTSLWAKNAEP
jgi:hypothetical protein